MPATQTRRKRRVGRALSELRERSGRTAEEAAEFLGCSRSTITRIESGHVLCRRTELLALAAFYGATDARRAEILARWEDAKGDATRVMATGRAPRQLRAFLHAEAEASRSQVISPLVVDGLLQTEEYARAVNSAPSGFRGSDADIERAVKSRLNRQQLLVGPHPLQLHVLLDEAAIHRQVGGPDVMLGQLQRLLTLLERSHITLQVIPMRAGAYGTMSGGVVILHFDDQEDPSAAYVEYPGGGAWVEETEDVSRFVATFDSVRGSALSPAETADLIRVAIKELEGR
ncbi:helix-turn-helix domain-containing protein [Streptoalloteichus hindustanus]|uniref:DNA-binding transcriptional regulator, XRE-family HTH domain n=1 Tax=Streptoalloteichus hindustanus TaxID=2017 RepID=A0A1M4YNI1_STRHI|nr:helix-turn-helix transcriptional regulator [Streptoalloteichus hindustanus]SHF06946.1 DNA-binding transcriptional regulator, XRE-family HTH domain [Streptoalloteichus hindustanus]